MDEELWAVCELMGHVKLAGRLSGVEKFGSKMARLDIPKTPTANCPECAGRGIVPGVMEGDPSHVCLCADGFTTQFFGGAAVYKITIVTEAVARAVAARTSHEPIHAWEFPKMLLPLKEAEFGDDGDDR